ncbi:hypothetical protein [Actinoalloteichus sp. AHMU CJ021]|uniref:hypothetical protein n=1 Tax=Actinoalloteichus sp. AHMU CJ021 TaxID=2072503 RepID=UPI00307B85A8
MRATDRLTFVYLEHCVVHRDANAITSRDERGTFHIPAATLSVLMLGPGTTISHHAVNLLAESRSPGGRRVTWHRDPLPAWRTEVEPNGRPPTPDSLLR